MGILVLVIAIIVVVVAVVAVAVAVVVDVAVAVAVAAFSAVAAVFLLSERTSAVSPVIFIIGVDSDGQQFNFVKIYVTILGKTKYFLRKFLAIILLHH